MKHVRKTLSMILSLVMIFCLFIPVFAEGEEAITWTWDEQTKTLTFTGNGDMADADMSALSEAPTAETLQNMMPYGYG
ncbi:MAG: hypothetical protein K6G90_07365, partial [Clostridia bacterium]|nr:hypothetical protein [Clostridia bacterium]